MLCSEGVDELLIERPDLEACLDYLRPGDTLVVPSLDRLARSPQDLITLVARLRTAGIGFRPLHENIDTTTPGGRLVFHVFAALAEFIRELVVEGTHEGLAAARELATGRLPMPPACRDSRGCSRLRRVGAARPMSRRPMVMSRSALVASTACLVLGAALTAPPAAQARTGRPGVTSAEAGHRVVGAAATGHDAWMRCQRAVTEWDEGRTVRGAAEEVDVFLLPALGDVGDDVPGWVAEAWLGTDRYHPNWLSFLYDRLDDTASSHGSTTYVLSTTSHASRYGSARAFVDTPVMARHVTVSCHDESARRSTPYRHTHDLDHVVVHIGDG